MTSQGTNCPQCGLISYLLPSRPSGSRTCRVQSTSEASRLLNLPLLLSLGGHLTSLRQGSHQEWEGFYCCGVWHTQMEKIVLLEGEAFPSHFTCLWGSIHGETQAVSFRGKALGKVPDIP